VHIDTLRVAGIDQIARLADLSPSHAARTRSAGSSCTPPLEPDEYTAGTFREACTRCGITQSRGRVGSALDNAVIESFHSTIEFELRQLEHFATKAQARRRVAGWVEEYNHDRRHSSLGMRSPIAFELALQLPQQEQAA
jgi:transposase InsO family protein